MREDVFVVVTKDPPGYRCQISGSIFPADSDRANDMLLDFQAAKQESKRICFRQDHVAGDFRPRELSLYERVALFKPHHSL